MGNADMLVNSTAWRYREDKANLCGGQEMPVGQCLFLLLRSWASQKCSIVWVDEILCWEKSILPDFVSSLGGKKKTKKKTTHSMDLSSMCVCQCSRKINGACCFRWWEIENFIDPWRKLFCHMTFLSHDQIQYYQDTLICKCEMGDAQCYMENVFIYCLFQC